MQLGEEQQAGYDKIQNWLRKASGGYYRLGGYAGTGKTTLLSQLVRNLDGYQTQVMAYTGKAVNVLRSKGMYDAQTVHSTIYNVKDKGDHDVEFLLKDIDELEYDLFIVDEASMVDSKMFFHLKSFSIPILFVGDHGQLEPIGDPKWDKENPDQVLKDGLMTDPDYALRQVHRQALGNPILQIATDIRQKLDDPTTEVKVNFNNPLYYNTEKITWQQSLQKAHGYNAIICGTNNTRVILNKKVREKLWWNRSEEERKFPFPGDKVMCYRNSKRHKIFNGEVLEIIDVCDYGSGKLNLTLRGGVDGIDKQVTTHIDGFNHSTPSKQVWQRELVPFDYGYAATCHKAQGSEFGKVLIVYEPNLFKPWIRPGVDFKKPINQIKWLYTAVTRAKEFVSITTRT